MTLRDQSNSQELINPHRAALRALMALPDCDEAIRELAHGLASLARQTLGEQITKDSR